MENELIMPAGFSLTTNRMEFYNDILDEIKLFYPMLESENLCVMHENIREKNIINNISINGQTFSFTDKQFTAISTIESVRLDLRNIKLSVFKAFKGYCGRSMLWGSLTGIRPTKLAYDMLFKGIERENIAQNLCNEFLLSREKAVLVQEIIINQNGFNATNENFVNLYIHIPFCPSRCNYCSFVSTTIDKQKQLVQPYIDNLIKEIEFTKRIIVENGKSIYSVYIGGGTPTCISEAQLESVLRAVNINGIEFTCEAGRPETITKEKLSIMRKNGVTRISVNPQTLNEKTLIRISRGHTVQDFYSAFDLAVGFEFNINVDIIAGLEGETFEDFKNTIDNIVKLKPQNITVHTLSRKNGAVIKQEDYLIVPDIDKMVDYALIICKNIGYLPYYLYRQKNMLGNLENVGFCLPNQQCKNNITTMEESLSVYAVGAGAISKRLFLNEEDNSQRIERLANLKDVKLYNEQFEERLQRKKIFFS